MVAAIFPGGIASLSQPTASDTMDGTIGGIPLVPLLDQVAAEIDAIETALGVNLAGVLALLGSLTGPVSITMPVSSADGIDITFAVGATGEAIFVKDHTGAPIFAIPAAGGPKVFGDHMGAAFGVFGPEISFDATTSPPSIQMGDASGQTGHRLWAGAGTPSGEWVAGTTQANDLWYDTVHALWYLCISGGGGSAAGSWIVIGPFGGQIGYTPITANFTYSCTAATWTGTTATGTAPTITLPSDGRTYRVELTGSGLISATAGVITVGIGTAATNAGQITTRQCGGAASQVYPLDVTAQKVVGSGQTIGLYVQDASTATVTFNAAAAGTGVVGPCELAAYRVG